MGMKLRDVRCLSAVRDRRAEDPEEMRGREA